MTCFADTGFLLSLVAQDANTAAADGWREISTAIVITSDLAVFESENALRNLQLRGGMDEIDAASSRLALSTLILRGFVVPYVVRPRLLTGEARRLVSHFSPGVPHGTLDVLHVADTLATLHKNQRVLAAAPRVRKPKMTFTEFARKYLDAVPDRPDLDTVAFLRAERDRP